MKTRKVYPGEVHHVCQQTVGGVLVFYTINDYLVFFTIFCTVARRYGIKVLSLCPMVDHIHNVVVVDRDLQLASFVQLYTRLFAREWNESRGRKGSLFKHRYMSSVKLGNKQVKTTVNYSYNNPVERKLVERAEDYRWNFLRYARNAHPYSVPVNEENKSNLFRGILREMRTTYEGGGHLCYQQLERWGRRMDQNAMQQIADYAITGSDYEIREDRNLYSDAVYADCSRILLKEGWVKDLFQLPLLPIEKKKQVAHLLLSRTTARPSQIEKYLHLPPGR